MQSSSVAYTKFAFYYSLSSPKTLWVQVEVGCLGNGYLFVMYRIGVVLLNCNKLSEYLQNGTKEVQVEQCQDFS